MLTKLVTMLKLRNVVVIIFDMCCGVDLSKPECSSHVRVVFTSPALWLTWANSKAFVEVPGNVSERFVPRASRSCMLVWELRGGESLSECGASLTRSMPAC